MKSKNIIAFALAGLVSLPTTASEASKPSAGGAVSPLLQDINMFTPEDGAPAFKQEANERWGTQWTADAAYGFWGSHNAHPGTNNHNHYALLHAQLNQRLIGNTWLRAEVSGSWALDDATRRADRGGFGFISGIEGGTEGHADMYGSNGFFMPELALMQYFHGGRACVIAGLVNLTNYFDAVGIANDSFSNFVNTGFVNSSILPLADSNLGAVFQYAPDSQRYFMAAVSRTGCEMGYNPFRSDSDGYAIVAEYGQLLADGSATLRLTPFYENVDEAEGRHDRCGIAASIEYSPCEALTLYARAGVATKQALGGTAEFSCGATLRPCSHREDDFLGLSYGLFKHRNSDEHDSPTEHNREHVVELMYSFQLCEQVKIVPHFQYIHNPAYRADTDHAGIFGVQTVLAF